MATFTARTTSITQNKIIPKVFDNFLNDNFIPFRLMGNGKQWRGTHMEVPVKIGKNTQGGSFSGLDPHATGAVETRVNMIYRPKFYQIPVAVPGTERVINGAASETQVLNLVKVEMESSVQDALDDMGTLWYGDGTGNFGKDFEGFGNLVDDGTVSGTIGEISRTTYPTLVSPNVSFSGTLTLTKLANIFSDVSGGSSLRQRPSFIVSTEAEQNLYEQLLSPTVRANYEMNGLPVVTRTSKGAVTGLKGQYGFTSFMYRGVPWVADEKAYSGNVLLLNESYVEWYGIKDPQLKQISLGANNIDGVYTDAPSTNIGLQWTGFMTPLNQYGDVGHIYIMGNAIQKAPRRSAIASSVDGV